MGKASKKHQEKKQNVAQIHIITSCSYSTKLSPIFIIAFYPLSESWHRSERPAGLLIVPAALYRTSRRISPFESKIFLSEMIARIFIIVYNGIFIYIVKRGVSQPLMYGSLLVHGMVPDGLRYWIIM